MLTNLIVNLKLKLNLILRLRLKLKLKPKPKLKLKLELPFKFAITVEERAAATEFTDFLSDKFCYLNPAVTYALLQALLCTLLATIVHC